jgi:hypothetical protein
VSHRPPHAFDIDDFQFLRTIVEHVSARTSETRLTIRVPPAKSSGSHEDTDLVASLGLPVLGVDVAETALGIARQKAADRGIKAEFATA